MTELMAIDKKGETLAEKTTKLIDLNGDCLINIFEYVAVNDLVNIAEAYRQEENVRSTNQNSAEANLHDYTKFVRLIGCLETVFVKKRAHQNIVIFNQPEQLKHSLNTLRHFGKLILSVDLLFVEWCRHFDKEIEDYVFKYCRNSLNSIHIQNVDVYTIYGRQESFPNVETVSLRNGKIGRDLGRLNKLFPNLLTLELCNLETEDSECIEERFPLLQQVYIHNPEKIKYERFEWNDDFKWIFTNSNLRIFFKLNPQLRSVSLMHDVDDGRYADGEHGIKLNKGFLSYIQRNLPNLNKLELKVMQAGVWNGRGPEINFPNLIQLQIYIRYWDMLWHFPIASKKLHTLNLVCDVDLRINYFKIAAFVRRNANITTLQLLGKESGVFNLANEHMIALAKDLPNLRHVDVMYQTCADIIFHDVFEFMSHSKSLERLRMYYDYRVEANHEELEQSFQNGVTQGLPGRWKIRFSKKFSILNCFSYTNLAHYIDIEKDI